MNANGLEVRSNEIKKYTEQNIPVFPIFWLKEDGTCACGDPECGKNAGKHPLTKNGFKDATTDADKINDWLSEHPECNWAIPTGKLSGRFTIDIDPRNGGNESWEEILDGKEIPETEIRNTRNKGFHYDFEYPEDFEVKSLSNALAKGIDTKGYGGYVIIPPSQGYSANGSKVAKCPKWLLEIVKSKASKNGRISMGVLNKQDNWNISNLKVALNQLGGKRCDNYDSWIAVGAALSPLGDVGLPLWINWSKKSDKFQPGLCEEKWKTFSPDLINGLTPASIIHWAKEDNPTPGSGDSSKRILSEEYVSVIEKLGYDFKMLELDHSIEVNSERITDALEAKIRSQLRDSGYGKVNIARDAYIAHAYDHRYHPIKDYLEGLKWDGEDHINNLACYFKDKHTVFPRWLRKWLIGAIGRVYENGKQNRVFVLDGNQDIGKSYFVRWLAGPMDKYYIDSLISPDNKDDRLRLMTTWIWEISELGATTRKTDREALKQFLSREWVTERPPYGRNDLARPALTSFIATVNNESGFLNDPTGNRRFMTCSLIKINWDYAEEIDVNQLWAQAKALFDADESWRLEGEEMELVNAINAEYEVEIPVHTWLDQIVEFDPSETCMTTDLISALRSAGAKSHDDKLSKEIASYMRIHNLDKVSPTFDTPSGKRRGRGWSGVKLINQLRFETQNQIEDDGMGSF